MRLQNEPPKLWKLPRLHTECRPRSLPIQASLPRKRLGACDISVSRLCFGTMLFGESTSAAEADVLLHTAAELGVNFFDSAEMYPVPQSERTQGASEVILGRWLSAQRREEFVVSTKVSGPGNMPWLRGGPEALDGSAISEALDSSLTRLGCDYIDLYQLHWPDRYVPMFGESQFCVKRAYASAPLEEQLEALGRAMDAGKVRQIGLSNETSWGLMECCRLAKASESVPKVATLQNAYSLLCRTFETSMAECCFMEDISLLAYSPLAMGLLTGKYLDGGPSEARLNKYRGCYAEAESRYGNKINTVPAVREYAALAEAAGLSPTALTIRFTLSNPLVASAIVGATSVKQLEEIAAAAALGPLAEDILEAIEQIHLRYPNPNP